MRKHAFFPLTSKMFSPGAALGPTCVGDCGAVTFADRHRREACESQPLRRGPGGVWGGCFYMGPRHPPAPYREKFKHMAGLSERGCIRLAKCIAGARHPRHSKNRSVRDRSVAELG